MIDKHINPGTMFYHAANTGVVNNKRPVQIGLRTTNNETLGFNVLDARWVQENAHATVAEEIKRVCGGLSSYQAIEIIIGIAVITLVGMDVMEVAPRPI